MTAPPTQQVVIIHRAKQDLRAVVRWSVQQDATLLRTSGAIKPEQYPRIQQSASCVCHACHHNRTTMPFDRPPPGRTLARHALLCLLLLGVLLHGQAGVLRKLLGAAHWHAQPTVAAANALGGASWLARVQAWRQSVQASFPLAGGHAAPGHHHGGSERHHHSHQDETVVTLEPGGGSADRSADTLADTLAGSLMQPLGLANLLRWPHTAVAAAHWPHGSAAAWRNAAARLPERPPRG